MNKKILTKALNDYYFFFNGESFLKNDCGENGVTIYYIVNQRLLSLRAKGLDLQYKIHSNKNCTFIELAFTVFPYWETCKDKDFIGRVKEHYSENTANKILYYRGEIKKAFSVVNTNFTNYEISEYENSNFIWLVRHVLSNFDEVELIKETNDFINKTYPFLENILKKLEL